MTAPKPAESPADWYRRSGHCFSCGQPGNYCLCRKPCGCADLHEVGSGLTVEAADLFGELSPTLVDADQGDLFG